MKHIKRKIGFLIISIIIIADATAILRGTLNMNNPYDVFCLVSCAMGITVLSTIGTWNVLESLNRRKQ